MLPVSRGAGVAEYLPLRVCVEAKALETDEGVSDERGDAAVVVANGVAAPCEAGLADAARCCCRE